ncbi:pyridoxamine 5'-phosphate oxidase family protein [Nocardia transvalensis]|uniref:pyridoxamine 5'-phosphate oxidase family protein n=1 Tax=Nocardia transvalensis TaxID=37333 RepID=UPI001893C968|nr:pyridoxamine 5'-phosphate oxidase family protein [Nocardia transvalensis]MBF6328078.1 pyridoxamine 5'-phosphate oxidase family protein [Nocardia transvalensis]
MTIETINLDIYGNEPLPWARARQALENFAAGPGVSVFLSTCRPDGRPHTAGVGAVWLDEGVYMVSGPSTRKSRNLAANPSCTVAFALEGLDLVLEGTAAIVTDAEILERIAARYRELGWPAEVHGDAFTAPYSAPSAGPPPWHLYFITPHAAVGVATAEPHGATRWRLA